MVKSSFSPSGHAQAILVWGKYFRQRVTTKPGEQRAPLLPASLGLRRIAAAPYNQQHPLKPETRKAYGIQNG